MTADNRTIKVCSKCKQAKPATLEHFQCRLILKDGLRGVCKICVRLQLTQGKARRLQQGSTQLENTFKRCTHCAQEKLATVEFFRVSIMGKLGLRGECRTCEQALIGARRAAYQAAREAEIPTASFKLCSQCGEKKPATLTFFRKRSEVPDGLRAECRVCQNKSQKQWADNNRAKVNASIKRWTDTHPAQVKTRQRQWAEDNPERIRARQIRFRKTPKGVRLNTIQTEKRRARRQALPDIFTSMDWDFCIQYWHYACAICGNQRSMGWTLAMDHWIPLSDPLHCPGTVPWNILPLCHGIGGCNNKKYKQNPWLWLERKLGSREAEIKRESIERYFALVLQQKG